SLISRLDKALRRGKSGGSDFRRGLVLALIVMLLSGAVPALLLFMAWKIDPWIYFAVESIMCAQLLAARQLVRESVKVEKSLEAGDIDGARKNVAMIVGRDTDVLDGNGICRAAVETVAENSSDGVIAPILWMFLFGAVGGFLYKSINTMDSMIGYKNDKYMYFGRAAAKLDDFVNYIPARISALLMIAVAPLCRQNGSNAMKIYKRDRYKHASPNSAQTEAVCAGALGIRLAGDARYGGVWHKKEYIGDPLREIEYKDITRASALMYAASAAALLLCTAVRAAVIILCL
ncbi:MAG: adenosylcobinamide-phosphate synthase CbiB, partial [Eubacteriales bacterium]